MKLAVSADGDDAAASYELGRVRLAAGDTDGAIAAYVKCMTFGIRSPAIFNNLGTALLKAARYDEAIDALKTALLLQPGYTRALVNLGKAFRDTGRLAEAVVSLREALTATPDYIPALINLGDAFAAARDWNSARQALERAIQLAPRQPEPLMALGVVYAKSGHTAQALVSFNAAIALAPHHADAHCNLAALLFSASNWQEAWPHFEYRLGRTSHPAKLRSPQGMARWDGTLTAKVSLWLIGEQGLGDQLQFVRYAKLLQELGADCTLACEPKLVALLSCAGLGARVTSLEAEAEITSTARWFPLQSLPAWHRTNPRTVPAADGYLTAEQSRVVRWRTRLPAAPRVALSWAGNPRMETGQYHGRSPPLSALAPLLCVTRIQFISLQKGSAAQQLDSLAGAAYITRFTDLDVGCDAFVDTAAILTCVDLLITSDTAIAHLAGALGVPTWLCLMHDPDWRWMTAGTRTPWYTSLRLFRQATPGDWPSVYVEVAEHLSRWRDARAP